MLVHGSEGTDTTLLVTSLARLILDPECRTISGFQALIDREWIQVRSLAHQSQERGLKTKVLNQLGYIPCIIS